MKTVKVNNVKIKPIITDSHPVEKIGGFKLFPEPFCNVAIVAKKKVVRQAFYIIVWKSVSVKILMFGYFLQQFIEMLPTNPY